jgi:hypothetical protein
VQASLSVCRRVVQNAWRSNKDQQIHSIELRWHLLVQDRAIGRVLMRCVPTHSSLISRKRLASHT